jgi:fused signal recognition particle receptor
MIKIQLLDDEPHILSALQRVLRPHHWEVHAFSDGQQALQALTEHEYAVIVSDYKMPNLDGITYLQFAKQRQPNAMRMVLSAHGDRHSMMQAINRAEIYRFLSKPWEDYEIETALLTADVGVNASTHLVEGLRRRMKAREFADANALLRALRADLVAMLAPVAVPLEIDAACKPFVILTVGVNGVGKTTTIGKLARRYKDEGRGLMLAAGDTFRAAAVAQLQAWGDRNGVAVVAQGQDADPASVAFDALQAAKARGVDVLIADTAGRLHTQQGLMAELGKIRRVLGKLDASAPHEVLMVIDGTTGQNAISQVRQFNAAVNVTGLVVTKLDGTAKGGVVFALAREFGIPIRYAGIGERPEDLRVFDAEAFVDALLPETLEG